MNALEPNARLSRFAEINSILGGSEYFSSSEEESRTGANARAYGVWWQIHMGRCGEIEMMKSYNRLMRKHARAKGVTENDLRAAKGALVIEARESRKMKF